VDELTRLDDASAVGPAKVHHYLYEVEDCAEEHVERGLLESDDEEPDYGGETPENPEEDGEHPHVNEENPANNEENPYDISSSHGPVIMSAITALIDGKVHDILSSSSLPSHFLSGIDPLMATVSLSEIDMTTGVQVNSSVAHLLLMDIPSTLLARVLSHAARCIREKLDVGQFLEQDPQRLLPSAFAHFHIPIPDCLNERMRESTTVSTMH
jgi:hypothetical protein